MQAEVNTTGKIRRTKAMYQQLGQLFIIGYPGEVPSKSFLHFIAEEQIGGVILFADNCATHQVARQNIETIRSAYRTESPFIAIDQEGGRVCRLKGAPVEYRSAASYGKDGNLEHFAEEYSRAAVYMQELGINMNLAPVADIAIDPENSCIKDRAFGSQPELVARFVAQSVATSKAHGLISCLKHFPGFGAAKNDPHLKTSIADYELVLWQQRERVPFLVGLEAGADMIMTTHLRLPKLDDKMVTCSPRIIQELIRGSLEFDGPVITDDLCMGGAVEIGDPGERAVAAFNAGHDILLFGQQSEVAMQAFDYFVDACKRGEISAERIRTSLARVSGLKFKLGRSAIS
ncbi:MAG: glycoside hydrolase family 3 protein [bacterium]|nr:glycoside hydrolase family 3 protein [bacterium]